MEMATVLFLAFIILQRLSELVIARRNTALLLARGAYEVGAAHYPMMVAMHSAWIVCLVLFGYDKVLSFGWLTFFALLQVIRLWVLISLGSRWTTRIIILEEPLIVSGPFKYVSHPNYMLVVAEIIVAPLVLGLVWVAVIFTLLNAAMLWVRIEVEHKALAPLRTK
ncbi:isoprenylcysteine carboxyl methyltransferase family protein [Sulfitobacter sp. 915]|jgi:methyltransferase|uniref:isoprenylcysteine carboxyl methyltransferase family protein n=1 Tax=Sulfitobacter sp. 915 TaxID=3368558 RepID=UPI003744C563